MSNCPSCLRDDNPSLQRCSRMADGTNYQGSHAGTRKVFKVIHGVIMQLNIASNIFCECHSSHVTEDEMS